MYVAYCLKNNTRIFEDKYYCKLIPYTNKGTKYQIKFSAYTDIGIFINSFNIMINPLHLKIIYNIK